MGQIGPRGKDDLKAELLETPDQPVTGAKWMKLIKVAAAHFPVFSLVAENAEGDDENAMRQGDDCLPQTVLTRVAVEAGGKKAVLCAGSAPGRLAQCSPQPAIPFARAMA